MIPTLTDESFGQSGFLADRLRDDQNYLDQTAEQRAQIAGWLAGCPIVNELVDARGAETMAERYDDINFWFSFIQREAKDVNPELDDELSASIRRLPDEPVGKHEPESVPPSYFDKMPPATTLTGFALPRMAIEFLTAEGNPENPWPSHRIDGLIKIVRDAVKTEVDPLDLLVKVGNEMAEDEQVDPAKLLKHMLNSGWLEEHNAVSVVKSLKSRLEAGSGELCTYYQLTSAMSEQAKAELGIPK